MKKPIPGLSVLLWVYQSRMILVNVMKYTESGLNQENIQNMNRTLLLNLLRRKGTCARVDLAKQSGLRQATVTYIINDFMKWGLVHETGLMTGQKGRRSIAIGLDSEQYAVAGIRIARKNYSIGLFNLYGKSIEVKRRNLEKGIKAREVLDEIMDEMEKMIDSRSSFRVLALGAAIPGPYSFREGRIELMSGVEGWDEIPLEEELKKRFRVPVVLEQDANAGALAQYWHDPGASQKSVLVYVAAGQGIGAGIISDGKLMRGDIGTAGEIGHTSICYNGPRCTCGNYGCLENYCSSIAFTRRVNEEYMPEKEFTFEDARRLVRGKDRKAVQVFLECCDYLSVGIVNAINIFNPQIIVIGDEMAHIEPELMLERIMMNVRERVVPNLMKTTEIRMNQGEKDSMIHGAAVAAIHSVFHDPAQFFSIGA